MRRIRYEEEAERLNVPVDSVKTILEKGIAEGNIYGIIDSINQEVVYYKPEEITNLTKSLRSGRVSIQDVAKKLGIKPEQVRLIINKLLQEERIEGCYTYDDAFVSDTTIQHLVYDLIEKTEKVNIQELSNDLLVPVETLRFVIEKLNRKIVNVLKPYRKISFSDLSQEVNMSEKLTITLLKKLISKGRIDGVLDTVNRILTKDQTSLRPIVTKRTEVSKEQRIGESNIVSKPSDVWYLVPLFLGIIGGAIGYLAVKDDDKNMANNLLILGIVSSIISTIVIWGYYGWYISQLLRWY